MSVLWSDLHPHVEAAKRGARAERQTWWVWRVIDSEWGQRRHPGQFRRADRVSAAARGCAGAGGGGVSVRIFTGDVRAKLAELTDESVHCVVTSPPYWGLRDYGIEPQVWGGDAGCEHSWSEGLRHTGGAGVQGESSQRKGRANVETQETNRDAGNFCRRCTAWRGSLGLEPTIELYVEHMVEVFRAVKRVLRSDGTCWMNLGDCYAHSGASGGTWNGSSPESSKTNAGAAAAAQSSMGGTLSPGLKPKDLCMVPARVALALQADGWWLRSEIVWAKPNPMPESVTDRPTSAHEKVFLLSKSARYAYDTEAVREAEAVPDWDNGTRVFGGVNKHGANIKHGERTTGRLATRRSKKPDGWDTGEGAHGTVHRDGREKGEPSETRTGRNVWTIATAPFTGWTDSIDLVPVPVSEALGHGAEGNEPGGDTARITSPDCLNHAGHPDLLPKGFCDGLRSDQLSRIRGTSDDRADSVSTPPTHAHSPAPPSKTDYSGLEDCPTATSHNTQSRKTARDLETSERATLFEETAESTERNELSKPSPASISRDTDESKSEADSPVLRSEPEIPNGTVHKRESGNSCEPSDAPENCLSSCSCRYYRKVVKPQSHFATFPPKLVEPCIKAGTSEKGVCAACGAPWRRGTEATYDNKGRTTNGPRSLDQRHETAGFSVRLEKTTKTTGWSPSCACNADTVPAVILDPFAGAGTTGLVADRLGRDAILIELNPEYAEMAAARIRGDLGTVEGVGHAEPDGLPLFAGDAP